MTHLDLAVLAQRYADAGLDALAAQALETAATLAPQDTSLPRLYRDRALVARYRHAARH